MTDNQPGMLLVGHGTRDERGAAECLRLAELVRSYLPGVVVEAGFLELATPTISDALSRLVDRGVVDVVVTPLLLFAAGHAKEDIPTEVGKAAERFPGLVIRQAEPLGCHKQILAASASRFVKSIQRPPSGDLSDVALVIVSRGSSDQTAISHVTEFAESRGHLTSVGELHVGFMAVADPPVRDVLRLVASSDYQTIVIQPHLLFHGKVLQDLSAMVDELRKRASSKYILLTEHIGPCAEVALAAIDRYREAIEERGD